MHFKTKLILILYFIVFRANAFEHNPAAPLIAAPHTGQVVSSDELQADIEVLRNGAQLKIYIYNKEMKPENLQIFTVSANTQLPKEKKHTDLTLILKDSYFEAQFNPKKSKIFDLYLAIKNKNTGKEDLLKYSFLIKN